jgi:hypothetical protein
VRELRDFLAESPRPPPPTDIFGSSTFPQRRLANADQGPSSQLPPFALLDPARPPPECPAGPPPPAHLPAARRRDPLPHVQREVHPVPRVHPDGGGALVGDQAGLEAVRGGKGKRGRGRGAGGGGCRRRAAAAALAGVESGFSRCGRIVCCGEGSRSGRPGPVEHSGRRRLRSRRRGRAHGVGLDDPPRAAAAGPELVGGPSVL